MRGLLSTVASIALISAAFADGYSGGGGGGSSSLTVGTTVVTGGSTGNIEYNNGGVLGERTASGTGTKVVTGSGTFTSGDCAKFDANSNLVDQGAACGTPGVTSLSTSCPSQAGQPLTGAVTLPFGVAAVARNPVAGATDTWLTGDCGQSIEYTDAAAVAVTVPQAGSAGFLTNWVVNVAVKSGAGPVTFTTTTSVFSSSNAVTFVLYGGQSATFQSDGTNWNVYSGIGTNISNAQLPVGNVSGSSGLFPGYAASTWYLPLNSPPVNTAGATGVVTTQYCSPGIIGPMGGSNVSGTLGQLGARITTLGTSNIQLGIYNDDPAPTGAGPHRPGTLVGNTGNIVDTATGSVSGTITAVSIKPGTYWFCLQINDTTGIWAVSPAANAQSFGQISGSATLGNVLQTSVIEGVTVTSTFGTWAGTLHGATFTEAGARIPVVAFLFNSIP